jgi:hypothetical protein
MASARTPLTRACTILLPNLLRAAVCVFSLAALALIAGGDPGPAQAALTFNINVTADVEDPLLNDNNCDVDLPSIGNQCTLRAAISQANFTDGLQIINVPAGTYNITLGSLRISDEVTINGAGAEVVFVDASAIDNRVFWNLASAVEISGMTIRNGTAPVTFPSGGGIRNTGELTLTNVDVRSNAAEDGGGIYNESTLALVDSVVRDNTASEDGGGILNGTFGNLSITDSVISGNDTYQYDWAAISILARLRHRRDFTDNYAIWWRNREQRRNLTLTSSTLSDNFADASGGGIGNYGAS